MNLSRAEEIEFTRADGSLRLVVPPLTWGQYLTLLGLDPDADAVDAPLAAVERTIARLEIMLEHATCTDAAGVVLPLRAAVESLVPQEIHEINAALMAGLMGIVAPETAAALQTLLHEHLKKNVRPAGAAAQS